MKLRELFNPTKQQPITQDREMTDEPKKSAGPEEVAQHLESLAREKEIEVLAQCEAKAQEYRELHESDVGMWKFECRRYGDFLSLFVRRQPDYDRHTPYLSASINLAPVKRMELQLGHRPDWLGSVGYGHSYRKISSDAPNSWNHSRLSMPPAGYEFEIHAGWPWHHQKPIIAGIDNYINRAYSTGGHDYSIKLVTPNCPRPAEDDRINFYGIDQTLHTPAGLGEAAYTVILEQCAEWDRFARESRI